MTDKVNASVYDENDVVLVCGSTIIPDSVFELKYKPLIEAAVAANAEIHIGSAPGCDQRTRKLLLELSYDNFTVYVPGKHADKEKPTDTDRVCVVDGGYRARDTEMCKCCNKAIVFLSQYGGGGSGSCANLLTVAMGVDGIACTEAIRAASMAWSSEHNQRVYDDEAKQLSAAK